MTNEEFVEEVLIRSHELGIYNEVIELSDILRKDYGLHNSILTAFQILTSQNSFDNE